ncbi:MAG: VOC family protein [Lachnospiraceae bacterium]|nr:VOC family protein [Lachnospiraceae bacterium]
MTSRLHHAALNVVELDWYTDFFKTVFGMSVRKTAGSAPARKIWFEEGIQLNECAGNADNADGSSAYDHLAIAVEDKDVLIREALAHDCTRGQEGPNWIYLPNGVKIELM